MQNRPSEACLARSTDKDVTACLFPGNLNPARSQIVGPCEKQRNGRTGTPKQRSDTAWGCVALHVAKRVEKRPHHTPRSSTLHTKKKLFLLSGFQKWWHKIFGRFEVRVVLSSSSKSSNRPFVGSPFWSRTCALCFDRVVLKKLIFHRDLTNGHGEENETLQKRSSHIMRLSPLSH